MGTGEDLTLSIRRSLETVEYHESKGDKEKALVEWKRYIGLLEVQMGRTGTPDRLTPVPEREPRLPNDGVMQKKTS